MKTVAKAAAAGSGLVVAGMVGFAAWAWVDSQRAQRELDLHFEEGKAYAARVLEELGAVPRRADGELRFGRQPHTTGGPLVTQ